MTTRILIIDDERVICEACRLAFSERGYSVTACMTGRSGLEAILEGRFDVVLLDMKLPDMDGMEILRTTIKQKPSSYVIVMTGYSTVPNAVEAMKQGAFDYLGKPFSEDQLLLAVEKALEKKRLVEENLALRRELVDRFGFSNIVGESPVVLKIFDQVRRVAPTDSTVLLSGESGTGKELFARAIHAQSQRAAQKFLAIDCTTLASGLVESELFGHVKGAFTGAHQDSTGLFEVARKGTLFLDDVANLGLEIQAKLLRVIEMQEFKPVGTSSVRKTDVRIIAATNKDLRTLVREELFREDLFYRLNVFPIFLPPLRERKEDIPRLAYHFLRHFCRKTGKSIQGFSDDAMKMLVNYEWPGNVRQLKNVIERLVIMADRRSLDLFCLLEDLQMRRSARLDSIPETLDELRAFKKHLLEEDFAQVEKAFLIKALKTAEGNITHAAERVGMQRSNFSALMKKHHVNADDAKP
ncbi:MAG: sigma-54-dependent Fis family transcriptional regulator [Deltaproteobacteria bacterium HGW-Deltaproteobacteria-15]|jgi:DNA-binding NtrC family response regulator|nr:MAG: sigma-54-dependent Fis family transcriptional regulator [Deltaproteobacteria bacterium HGW-Deltaproteobacteria-15]